MNTDTWEDIYPMSEYVDAGIQDMKICHGIIHEKFMNNAWNLKPRMYLEKQANAKAAG
jgi:hypothetical protein